MFILIKIHHMRFSKNQHKYIFKYLSGFYSWMIFLLAIEFCIGYVKWIENLLLKKNSVLEGFSFSILRVPQWLVWNASIHQILLCVWCIMSFGYSECFLFSFGSHKHNYEVLAQFSWYLFCLWFVELYPLTLASLMLKKTLCIFNIYNLVRLNVYTLPWAHTVTIYQHTHLLHRFPWSFSSLSVGRHCL